MTIQDIKKLTRSRAKKECAKCSDDEKPSANCFVEMFRLGSQQIIFGGEHLSHVLPQSRGWVFWDKETGDNQYADGELIWTSSDIRLRKFKWQWKGMFQENMNAKEERFHPTQKPVPLLKWLLENYGMNCETIFDPFLGSGTTAVAAKALSRKFIEIEISEKYCEMAVNRLRQEILL